MLLQRKNDRRDASSTIGDSVDLAGLDAVGRALEAKHELGRREDPAQRHLDAGVEPALLASRGVEVHQRRELLAVDGVAERARRERLDDLPARTALPRARWRAGRRRCAAASRVSPTPVTAIRPRHGHAREVRHERPIGIAVDGGLEQAELERLNDVLDGRVILLDERRADRVRAGFDGHSDRGARLDRVLGEIGEQDALRRRA